MFEVEEAEQGFEQESGTPPNPVRHHRSRKRSFSRRRRDRGSESKSSPRRRRRRRESGTPKDRRSRCDDRNRKHHNRHHRNKRRSSTVSTLSSSSDSASAVKSSVRRSKKRNTTQETEESVNVSARELLNLVKSLPTSQNHFSMNNNAIPEFDPSYKEQTVDIWINKLEECSKLYGWSEPQLLHYSLPKLMGLAKVWYQGLSSVNFTWSEWKDKLIKTFPSVQNYAQLLQEMLDRKVKPNETLETYFYHKMNLLNRCEIYDKKAIDCIINGLEDRSMRLGAQAANYNQPEQLLAYLQTVKLEDNKEIRRPFLKKRFEGQSDNKSNNSSSTIKCFNCGELGHPSFKCLKPLVTCNICKKLGHQSASCRRLLRNTIDNNTSNKNCDK